MVFYFCRNYQVSVSSFWWLSEAKYIQASHSANGLRHFPLSREPVVFVLLSLPRASREPVVFVLLSLLRASREPVVFVLLSLPRTSREPVVFVLLSPSRVSWASGLRSSLFPSHVLWASGLRSSLFPSHVLWASQSKWSSTPICPLTFFLIVLHHHHHPQLCSFFVFDFSRPDVRLSEIKGSITESGIRCQ